MQQWWDINRKLNLILFLQFKVLLTYLPTIKILKAPFTSKYTIMGQGINKQPDPEEVELQDNLEKKWTDIFNSLDEENKPPDNKINCTILREKIRKDKDIANNLEFRKTYIEGRSTKIKIG